MRSLVEKAPQTYQLVFGHIQQVRSVFGLQVRLPVSNKLALHHTYSFIQPAYMMSELPLKLAQHKKLECTVYRNHRSIKCSGIIRYTVSLLTVAVYSLAILAINTLSSSDITQYLLSKCWLTD